ncbi:methyl-accepting chemotaxis protein [Metabacillus sediminilitoris]|nr:methyl-accepting chemotaxis protein [Metabacillus sediminilitoris]QGQ44634.1 HAMP domain-containing protein [Metabacillus sediminilitoris]
MTIKKKLLINSVTVLVLAILIVAFIIINMLSIQSSNKDQVPVLLNIEKLAGEFQTTKQGLNNFSITPSDAQKQEVLTSIEKSDRLIGELKNKITNPKSKTVFNKLVTKYEQWKLQANSALESKASAEVKRQSIRLDGIGNDLYLVNAYANEQYILLQENLKKQLSFVIISSIVGCLILIVLSTFIAILMTNSITRPLKKLAHNAEQISTGHLVVEEIHYQAKDELGQLNTSFMKMVEQLRTLLSAIDTVSKDVEGFAKDLETENKGLTEISNQVAISTNEMSIGTQSISSDLQDAVSLIEHMDKEFRENVNRSEQSVLFGEEAVTAITSGKNAMDRQHSLMLENMQTSQTIDSATKAFTEYAGEIENMAKTVSRIADQTNLLALNAAIEAARAGEAGKGFAVVADEVRKLAEESTSSTKHIFEMVAKMKERISHISDSVRKGVLIAENQQDSMETTTKAFENIGTKVEEMIKGMTLLATGVNQSKQFGEQVLNTVENISAVVEETAAGNEEISASTTEQLAAFEKNVEKVISLRELTDDLNNTLGRFKL